MLKEPCNRFLSAFVVCALLSSAWPIVVRSELGDCHALLDFASHELTYLVIHFTAFPFAVGWMAAHLNRDFCFPSAASKWPNRVRVGMLAILYAIMVCVSYSDFVEDDRYLLTYVLRDACRYSSANDVELARVGIREIGDFARREDRDKIQNVESKLKRMQAHERDEAVELLQVELDVLNVAYSNPQNPYLQHRKKGSLAEALRKSNWIVPTGAALTLFYQLAAATAVWCVLLHFANTIGFRENRLADIAEQVKWLTVVIIAFAAWLPVRAYVNSYEDEFGLIPAANSEVVFASVVAAMVVFSLQFRLALLDPARFEKLKSVIAVVLAMLTYVVVEVPNVAESVSEIISGMPGILMFGLVFVSVVILVAVSVAILWREEIIRVPDDI